MLEDLPSKLLGWEMSTWAHYDRVREMVIICLRVNRV